MSEIVPATSRDFGVQGVRWTETSLELPDRLDFADYELIGETLGRVRDMSAWALGDWILAGEQMFGEGYAQAIEKTKRAEQTLVNYASVCRRVARSRRRPGVSFSIRAEVAALQPREQVAWLDRAESERLTVAELRGLLRPKDDLPTSVNAQEAAADTDWQETTADMAESLAARLRASGHGRVVVWVEVELGDGRSCRRRASA